MNNETIYGEFARHIDRAARHYNHARRKHPYFCNALFDDRRRRIAGGPEGYLEMERHKLSSMVKAGIADFVDLAECEVAEMFDAYAKGDNAAAVEECYDIIAVLLRAIDVIEGRQALDKPKKGQKGGAE